MNGEVTDSCDRYRGVREEEDRRKKQRLIIAPIDLPVTAHCQPKNTVGSSFGGPRIPWSREEEPWELGLWDYLDLPRSMVCAWQ